MAALAAAILLAPNAAPTQRACLVGLSESPRSPYNPIECPERETFSGASADAAHLPEMRGAVPGRDRCDRLGGAGGAMRALPPPGGRAAGSGSRRAPLVHPRP